MHGHIRMLKSFRVAGLVALTLPLAMLSSCKGGGVVSTIGIPQVEFGGVVGQIQATGKTQGQCELDIDFGNVPIGVTGTATVKVANSGSGSLDISLTNPTLDPEFSLVFGNQPSIGSGSVGEFPVTFSPYKTGQVTSTFTVETDGTNIDCSVPDQLTVTLTGTGIQLDLVVQPEALDFGNTIVNTTTNKTVTLTNNSDAEIDSIVATVGGTDANIFTVLDAPTTLPAHGQATVHVVYEPLAVETRSLADVTFAGAGGETATFRVFGEPLSSALTLLPNPINFGYAQLESTVVACSTVTNQANIPITVKSIASFATAGGAFAISATDDSTPPKPFTVPVTLASGASSEVCFSFTPPITQQYQGQATLITSDPSGVDPVVKMTGWGGGPQITCIPTTVTFGETLDQSVASVPVMCTNTGTTLPGIKLVMNTPKASPYAFTAEFDTGINAYPVGGLVPGESVQIDVNYAPTAASNDTGTLYVTSNGGKGGTLQIPLAGQGLDIPPCQFQLAPSSLNFGNVTVGETSPVLSFAIENLGSNICLVQGPTIKNDTSASFHILSTSIAADPVTGKIIIPSDSSLTISMNYEPTQATPGVLAEAAFTISDPSGPNQVIPLAGSSAPTCLVVTPTTLNFGEVGQDPIGALCGSGSRGFSVFNECSIDATLESITLQSGAGDNLAQFADPVGPSVPQPLPAGSSAVSYETFFDPTSLGAHSGQFLISDGTIDTLVSMQGAAVASSDATDTFIVGPPKADLLFIMDVDYDEYEQGIVADGFPQLFSSGAGIDYRMALTTDNDGDTATAEFGRLLPCQGCSLNGSSPTIISPLSVPKGGTTPDPETAWTNLWSSVNAELDLSGDDFFAALYNAIIHRPQQGVDFFRPGVPFASITDCQEAEADTSVSAAGGHNPSWYFNFFESTFQNPSLFTWNFIAQLNNDNGTGFAPPNSLAPNIGTMVSATGGLAFNSEDSNWPTAFESIWQQAIAASAFYTLQGTPSQGQSGISVTLDGVPLAEFSGPSNPNWTYQSTLNAVVFNQATVSLKSGATIAVTYPIGCK